jgi:nucleotidyltransferase/DNA polymerase involved in DNA repair
MTMMNRLSLANQLSNTPRVKIKLKTKHAFIKDLQTLPNIGKKTAHKLYALGIKTPHDMKHANPEALYEQLQTQKGGKVDRCVLYQFRGAKLNKSWWKL